MTSLILNNWPQNYRQLTDLVGFKPKHLNLSSDTLPRGHYNPLPDNLRQLGTINSFHRNCIKWMKGINDIQA